MKMNIFRFILLLLFLSSCMFTNSFTHAKEKTERKPLICYWGSWSFYRPAEGQFDVSDIDPFLCTHLIYTFVGIQSNYLAYHTDPYLDLGEGEEEPNADWPNNTMGHHDMIRETVRLRDNGNPDLKVLIAIGGWTEEYSARFSDLRRGPDRNKFVDSVKTMVEKFNLDGVDMDWEYPGLRGGRDEDIVTFPLLLQDLREALNELTIKTGRPYLLTSAFGCGKSTIDKAYDVPAIVPHIDYFHLMTYDYKVYSSESEDGQKIGHHSPLGYKTENDMELNVKFSAEYFVQLGAPPEKIVIGIGAYGRTYEMTNRNQHKFGDVAAGPGPGGEFTQEPGVLSYVEICRIFLNNPDKNWEFHRDYDYKIPYAFNDNLWIGYDDEISVKEKVNYAMSQGFAGMMIWSIDQDDSKNLCQGWENFALTAAVRSKLDSYHQS